jgi:hypothetical protein
LSPPSWWSDYFRYVSRTAIDADTARFLYALRRQSTPEPLTEDERAAYVERLQKDGAIAEAYLIWISGLDDNARRYLGYLFDGGFDLPIEGRGFGWRVASHRHFTAGPVSTQGASGRALRLRFHGFDGAFGHVSQPLFLNPGAYRLSGRVRIDSLASKGGVRWTVRCLRPEPGPLGEGSRFLGSSGWTDFELYFEVPRSCLYQQLTLVSGGTRSFERKLDGVIWFDDMRIGRAAAPDAAGRVDAGIRERATSEPSTGGSETAVEPGLDKGP